MSVDLERLDAAIAYIEAHPEEWRQDFWFIRTSCGTACCLAGTVTVQDGWAPTGWYTRLDGSERAWGVEKGGVVDDVERLARVLLGLTKSEAYRLFDANNDLDDIRRIRDELAAEATS